MFMLELFFNDQWVVIPTTYKTRGLAYNDAKKWRARWGRKDRNPFRIVPAPSDELVELFESGVLR